MFSVHHVGKADIHCGKFESRVLLFKYSADAGPIPKELGACSQLFELFLHNNALTGERKPSLAGSILFLLMFPMPDGEIVRRWSNESGWTGRAFAMQVYPSTQECTKRTTPVLPVE